MNFFMLSSIARAQPGGAAGPGTRIPGAAPARRLGPRAGARGRGARRGGHPRGARAAGTKGRPAAAAPRSQRSLLLLFQRLQLPPRGEDRQLHLRQSTPAAPGAPASFSNPAKTRPKQPRPSPPTTANQRPPPRPATPTPCSSALPPISARRSTPGAHSSPAPFLGGSTHSLQRRPAPPRSRQSAPSVAHA